MGVSTGDLVKVRGSEWWGTYVVERFRNGGQWAVIRSTDEPYGITVRHEDDLIVVES